MRPSIAVAGSRETHFANVGAIDRACRHVVIKNRPCKIVDMSTSKTGKHGHAKVNLVGIDVREIATPDPTWALIEPFF